MSVRTIRLSGGRGAVDVPVSGNGGVILWTIPREGATVKTAVSMNDGRGLDAAAKRNDGVERFGFDAAELSLGLPAGKHEVVHVDHAAAGTMHLELQSDRDEMVTVVAAEPDSPLKLVTWATPLSRRAGMPVTLFARVVEGATTRDGATVRARMVAPSGTALEERELFDDGAHNDGAAGDGLFAATVNDPGEEPGFWQVCFDAAGRDSNGHAYQRTGGTSFMNERSEARLLERAVRGEVVGQGTERVLRVTARATARREGNYRLDVIVAGPADAAGGREQLAWSETTTFLKSGSNVMRVEIPAEGLDGELMLDVRLLGLDEVGVAGRAVVMVGD
jgi:hypothetical protein